MKYNHTNRISLPCYEYAFRIWPLYEWSVNVSTTHSAVEISRKPRPPPPPPPIPSFPDTHSPRLYRVTVNKNIQTQRISHKNEYLVLNF